MLQEASYSDIEELATLLQHADVVVCNAGTILLDALVGDRPAVCVLYDEGAPPGESWAAKNVVGEHYQELAASGAFHRAERFEEVVAGIERALARPEELPAERRRAVEQVVGTVDGRAAERVVDAAAEHPRGVRGMRLVMTLLARDEADIVDAQIAFHLHAGVDFVVATDNRSNDGTTAILERYEREGRLHLIREACRRHAPGRVGDAHGAARGHRASRPTGSINADADEFWWPRGGSLKDVLATVPSRFGVVRGCWRHFLPRPDDGWFFAERMTMRLARPASPGREGEHLPRASEGRSPVELRSLGRKRETTRQMARGSCHCAAGTRSRSCTSPFGAWNSSSARAARRLAQSDTEEPGLTRSF